MVWATPFFLATFLQHLFDGGRNMEAYKYHSDKGYPSSCIRDATLHAEIQYPTSNL